MRNLLPLLILIILFCLPRTVVAADESPPKMLGQKMTYDPVGNQVFLFGGSYYSNQYTFYSDTWTYDSENMIWAKLAPQGRPSGRFNIAMAYDSDRGEIILFGGFSSADRVGDTWIYSIASNKWTQVYPETNPSGRSDAGAAYDAKNKKVIIFGGYGRNEQMMGDTWAFDTASQTWEQMKPATSPAIRYGCAIIYDNYTEKCLLFGGHLTASDGRDLGYENEIWAYDYAADSWEKITATTKPPARYWHDLAYDPEGNNIILFGGWQGSASLGDTWIYSCRDAKWTQVSSTVSPPARTQPSMAYDIQTKRVIMFGGADFVSLGTFNYYNDVWALGADNQWVQLINSGQITPAPQTSDGVPGFGPLEASIGLIVVVVLLFASRRRLTCTFK